MFEEKDRHGYEDIIDLPHHQSKTRPHMSLYDRAAQFSPFAALTGYESELKETARLTEEKPELSEEVKAELSLKLTLLRGNMEQHPVITITYFVPDEKKAGGAYITKTGPVKRMDEYLHAVILQNQEKIPIEDIIEISGELFEGLV